MKAGFTIIVALMIGALAAHLVLPDNGYALINFRGYIVETSVPVLVLLLIFFYVTVTTEIYTAASNAEDTSLAVPGVGCVK